MNIFSKLRHKSAEQFYRVRGQALHWAIHSLLHFRLLLRWVVLSVIMGVLLGLVGTAFVFCIGAGTAFRQEHWWCYLLMPLGGVLIVWLYRVTNVRHDKGTNMVIASGADVAADLYFGDHHAFCGRQCRTGGCCTPAWRQFRRSVRGNHSSA